MTRPSGTAYNLFFHSSGLIAVLALFASACGVSPSAPQAPHGPSTPTYDIVDTGPRGRAVVARDVDAAGRVLGNGALDTDTGSATAAFLWDAGTVAEYAGRTLRAMNRSGDLVGDADGIAYWWQGEEATPLVYGTAWDVNDGGAVVGEAATADGKLHGFLWQQGALTDLGTLGGGWSVAYGVNADGVAVGWSEQTDGEIRGCLWRGAQAIALPTLGGHWGMAYAINDAGEVTGYAATRTGTDHAFLATAEGTAQDLGSLGGTSIGYGIDNRGRVVGEATTTAGQVHAFLWQDGAMVDLNTLIAPASGWTLVRATAINDRGQIVGDGLFQGAKRPFLLTPTHAE